ncbi:hypothetical protein P879_01605 [Paragonimus westermani]|uniref:Uncharacterized protein n=1 Tax=Paragonimus westermani TaxID=34504 RepID=A0A8T0DJQ1_9TREM|nr:hypothetical protein P879_01605 [Paragonimus westermani]
MIDVYIPSGRSPIKPDLIVLKGYMMIIANSAVCDFHQIYGATTTQDLSTKELALLTVKLIMSLLVEPYYPHNLPVGKLLISLSPP